MEHGESLSSSKSLGFSAGTRVDCDNGATACQPCGSPHEQRPSSQPGDSLLATESRRAATGNHNTEDPPG